jgi:hypothetical protein
MSGRILLRLDKGLGWTKPLFVACCRDCGTELARHTNQTAATQAAGRRRCPTCGVRTARRLPGTTSPATDLDLTRRRPREPGRQPTADRPPPPTQPRRKATPPHPNPPPPFPFRPFLWKEPRDGSTTALADRHG